MQISIPPVMPPAIIPMGFQKSRKVREGRSENRWRVVMGRGENMWNVDAREKIAEHKKILHEQKFAEEEENRRMRRTLAEKWQILKADGPNRGRLERKRKRNR